MAGKRQLASGNRPIVTFLLILTHRTEARAPPGQEPARGYVLEGHLPRASYSPSARWQSGHAAACKAVYAGSIPTLASRTCLGASCRCELRVSPGIPVFGHRAQQIRVRNAKSREKAFKLSDERGLFLLVTPTGGRLWRFKYSTHDCEKLLLLGAYPDVALKRAREKREVARKLIADGIDPGVHRKAERAALAQSFEGVAKEWLELQSTWLAPETISILSARLDSGLYPFIGGRPVASITAQEVLYALRRIEARGRHETAHRVRALAARVFRYAVAAGRAQHDVAADLKGALAPVKSRGTSPASPIRRGWACSCSRSTATAVIR